MNDIETKLKALKPSAGSLDRDQLLYSAAFAERMASAVHRFPWRALCASLLATQIALIAWFAAPHGADVEPPPGLVSPEQSQPHEPPPTASPEPTSYIALMRHLGEDSPVRTYSEPSVPPAPLTPHSHID